MAEGLWRHRGRLDQLLCQGIQCKGRLNLTRRFRLNGMLGAYVGTTPRPLSSAKQDGVVPVFRIPPRHGGRAKGLERRLIFQR